jgi:hypothetical protein
VGALTPDDFVSLLGNLLEFSFFICFCMTF